MCSSFCQYFECHLGNHARCVSQGFAMSISLLSIKVCIHYLEPTGSVPLGVRRRVVNGLPQTHTRMMVLPGISESV